MSRLFLLRHAKAGWALPGSARFRPAARRIRPRRRRGHRRRHARRGYVPDLTLCSNARRARETLEGIAGHADTGRVLFSDTLYSEDAAGYLSLIHENADSGSLLVIGHNPMMEDLAMALSGNGEASRARGAEFRLSDIRAWR